MPAGCNGGRGGGGPVKNKEQCIQILSTKQTSPLANGSKLTETNCYRDKCLNSLTFFQVMCINKPKFHH